MIYRIVSDVSGNPKTKQNYFCIKVVNGTTLTYKGVFRERGLDTSGFETQAVYIGLCLISDSLVKGDTVIVNCDIPHIQHLMRKLRHENLLSIVLHLKCKGIIVQFKGICDKSLGLHNMCHNTAKAFNNAGYRERRTGLIRHE